MSVYPLFLQPGQAVLKQSLLPFVAGFRAYGIFLAQSPEVVSCKRFERKFGSLIHDVVGMPRHPASLARVDQSVTYVLNQMCYLCLEPAPEYQSKINTQQLSIINEILISTASEHTHNDLVALS